MVAWWAELPLMVKQIFTQTKHAPTFGKQAQTAAQANSCNCWTSVNRQSREKHECNSFKNAWKCVPKNILLNILLHQHYTVCVVLFLYFFPISCVFMWSKKRFILCTLYKVLISWFQGVRNWDCICVFLIWPPKLRLVSLGFLLWLIKSRCFKTTHLLDFKKEADVFFCLKVWKHIFSPGCLLTSTTPIEQHLK